MARQKWLLMLSVLTLIAPLDIAFPATAQKYDCAGTPDKAVMTLPLPLSKWGSIVCTPFGHVLSSHEGWVWLMPDGSDTVFIPSQFADKNPETLGNNSYFTKIEAAQVKGEESDEAYTAFHVGFDEKEIKPDVYRVDLTSVSGKTMRIFFFDYDTYAWGMTCPNNKCETDMRFMILDKSHRPEPRKPPI
jgi:hypothetical protein